MCRSAARYGEEIWMVLDHGLLSLLRGFAYPRLCFCRPYEATIPSLLSLFVNQLFHQCDVLGNIDADTALIGDDDAYSCTVFQCAQLFKGFAGLKCPAFPGHK